MKEEMPIRFRRDLKGGWAEITVRVADPFDVLNIANRHFGDPLKSIGGPKLPRLQHAREARE